MMYGIDDPREPIDDEDFDNGKETEGQEDDAEGERDGQDEDTALEGKENEEVHREVKPVGRAERAILSAKEEARAAREDAAKVRRELEEFRAVQQQQQRQVDPEMERQRLALMDPEQRMEYTLAKAQDENRRQIQRLEFNAWDSNDKANFRVLAATNQTAQRLSDKVEAELTNLRARGQNVEREILFKYMLGDEIFSKSKSAGQTQRKAGAENIRRQVVRPAGASSSETSDRRGGKSLEDRLAGITF